MIKITFKNLAFKYKYIFLCFGITILFLIFIALLFVAGGSQILSNHNVELMDQVETYLINTFYNISDFTKLFKLSFYYKVINNIFSIMSSEGDSSYMIGILSITSICALLLLLSFKVPYWVSKYINKQKIKDENTKTGIISIIINVIISISFAVLFTLLTYLWSYSIIIVFVVYIICTSFQIFFSVYLVYFKNIKFKKLYNIKDIFKIIGTELLTFLIYVSFAVILYFCLGIVSFIISLPLFSYVEFILYSSTIDYTKSLTMKALS